jgi:hypothetical protein
MENISIYLFKYIHDNPIEVYMTWIIPILTIIVLILYYISWYSDYSETFYYIKNL